MYNYINTTKNRIKRMAMDEVLDAAGVIALERRQEPNLRLTDSRNPG